MTDGGRSGPAGVRGDDRATGADRNEDGTVAVLLQDGPFKAPVLVRVSPAAVRAGKIKLQRAGGYDHFERTGAGANGAAATFTWTMRTRIAE